MATDKPRIEMEIADDGRLVIDFRVSEPPYRFLAAFTTGALDEHIQNLGMMRTGMKPSIPKVWKLGQPVAGVYRDPAVMLERDVKWSLETDQLAGDALLHMRHERFGWLHFIITKSIAADLAKQIVAIAQAPAPPARGSG